MRGSGKAADLLADCVLMRCSPKHEYHVEYAHRDERQRELMEFLTGMCGLRTGERDEDDYDADIITLKESDDHHCYNMAGVIYLLKSTSMMLADAENVKKMQAELSIEASELHAVVAWLDEYCRRAGVMPRNFWGQTKKETMTFDINKLRRDEQLQIISAYCDRLGLFCDISPRKVPDSDYMPRSNWRIELLIHSRQDKADMVRGTSAGKRNGITIEGASREPRELQSRVWNDEQLARSREIESKCSDIMGVYEMKLPADKNPTATGQNCCMLKKVLTAVTTNKCWVYELHSPLPDAPDFKSSLLSCLINGLGHPSSDDENTLARKLSYTILWQRVDVMEQVLNRSGLKDPSKRLPVLEEALIEAIARNEVGAVAKLLDSGASVDKFDVGPQSKRRDMDSIINLVRQASQTLNEYNPHDRFVECSKEMSKERAHRVCWEKLMRLGKQDTHAEYVRMLSAEMKEHFEDTASVGSSRFRLPCFSAGGKGKEGDGGIGEDGAEVGEIRESIEPLDHRTQQELYHVLSAQASNEARCCMY